MLGNELVYAQNNIARKMIEIENLLKNLQSVSEQGSTALYHLMKAAEAGESDRSMVSPKAYALPAPFT